jgi:hypothetical protein
MRLSSQKPAANEDQETLKHRNQGYLLNAKPKTLCFSQGAAPQPEEGTEGEYPFYNSLILEIGIFITMTKH